MKQWLTLCTATTLVAAASVAESLQCACAQAVVADNDFRTLGAPSQVHVCESEALLKLVQLNDEQRDGLKRMLDDWKRNYLVRQGEIDALPEADIRGRRGWPPTRDRELNADIMELLDDEQQKRFSQILTLWNYGPVRSFEAHRSLYRSELQLTSNQHRQLHHLQVKWVQQAFGGVAWPEQSSLGERVRLLVEIGTFGWEFKTQRDAAWSAILTKRQARRWRQIELQQYLLPQGVRFLVTGDDATG